MISTEPINTSDEEPTAQFLLVGLVIMRGTATLCSLKISLPPQVATLLVVLLSHLAFMASPLHARLVAEVSHGVDMTVMAAGEGSPAIGRQPLPGGHDGHCIIEWLKADQRIAQAIFFAIGGDAVILIPDLLIPGRRPVARALGPPATGDPQALLQVFRL